MDVLKDASIYPLYLMFKNDHNQNENSAAFAAESLLCLWSFNLWTLGTKGPIPVGKYLFKVNKITLEQRSIERCSNVILLTLNRYLPAGMPVMPLDLLHKNIAKYCLRN